MSGLTIKRALLSVSCKQNLAPLAKTLAEHHVEIISTGRTASTLKSQGIPVTDVSDVTGVAEMLGGRVKTLHPNIHGGILGRRPQDLDEMQAVGITPIDLVVVNLYPFAEVIKKPQVTLQDAIENIDIGGPTLIRAAAKNYHNVIVLTCHEDYGSLIDALNNGTLETTFNTETRQRLAAKAFAATSQYDTLITDYFYHQVATEKPFELPDILCGKFKKQEDLRYGENPHQKAAFYTHFSPREACVATATSLQGKPLSFNNLADADAALECVKQFEGFAAVIVKHNNPCGVAVAEDLTTAYQRAYATDPTAAFGGIIAVNTTLDAKTAKAIIDQQFVEVIIAPDVTEQAGHVLAAKSNIRVLKTGAWEGHIAPYLDFKCLTDSILLQEADLGVVNASDLKLVTKRVPTDDEFNDLIFSWKVAKFVKSNAIVYAKGQKTLGIGAGQMSRVVANELAAAQAARVDLSLKDSVMASDAFFPFADNIEAAAKAGCVAIIQPGGSIRDQEVIETANAHNLAMVFTGMRHFKH